MFGNVTALEGLHVTGKYRTQHDAHMLQACGMGSSQFHHALFLSMLLVNDMYLYGAILNSNQVYHENESTDP